jgi:lysozyme family protein
LVAAKDRYLAIAAKTGVPWFVIAVIHEREASQSWAANIAQGDPWNRRSIHVPIGRGSFLSFEDAAYDALVRCAPYAARNLDWSAGGTLTALEDYNGEGYFLHGMPSPYIWSGTDQYRSGKYVRDHVFDPNAVDVQLGCAGLILAMMAIDQSIKFGTPKAVPTTVHANDKKVVPAHPDTVPPPSIHNPAPGGIVAGIEKLFGSIFNKAA